MLSLMRSTKILGYTFHGGYEPGVSSDSGLELGKPLTFQYALIPYRADWREAGVYRAGMEFNHPLIVRKSDAHAGTLPSRWSFLTVSAKNVVTSALKPGPDRSAILRVYEAVGEAARGVKVTFAAPLAAAYESNLIEQTGPKLDSADSLAFDLRPFEIKNFKLQFRGAR
jgi:alpha-mannosidase